MKICWDNLEKVKFTKRGNFLVYNSQVYLYRESCKCCKQPFLMCKSHPTDFCSRSCSASGSNNPMYGRSGEDSPNLGKKRSIETRIKMSKSATGRLLSAEAKDKVSAASRGRRHSSESRKKISESKIGKKRSPEQIETMRNAAAKGKDSRFWKGGVRQLKIPLYDTYAHQINFAEEIKIFFNENGLKLFQVRCTYCNQWFAPSTNIVEHRISALNGRSPGEKRLYCSTDCKKNCPTYNQKLYPKGFKRSSSREVDPYTRKLCFERDGWACQKCGIAKNLHCHHIKGYAQNKILANDVDNCITLCKFCHKEVHKQPGCGYSDLRCGSSNFEMKLRRV